MFKRSTIVIFILLACAGIIFAAVGFDDQGNPNDPNENDRANACYEGGTLEGKCIAEIEWIAGWYLIRFEYGIFSADDIPEDLKWVLPRETSTPKPNKPDPSVTEEPK